MNPETIYKKFVLLLMWVVVYFSPIYEYLIIIGIIVMFDTILGSFAAHKKGRFISRKFRQVIWKSCGYFVAIGIAHMIELSYDLDLALKVTAGYITYTELVSLDENYFKITGKHIFKGIIDKLKK